MSRIKIKKRTSSNIYERTPLVWISNNSSRCNISISFPLKTYNLNKEKKKKLCQQFQGKTCKLPGKFQIHQKLQSMLAIFRRHNEILLSKVIFDDYKDDLPSLSILSSNIITQKSDPTNKIVWNCRHCSIFRMMY